jgi:hypothetical protein
MSPFLWMHDKFVLATIRPQEHMLLHVENNELQKYMKKLDMYVRINLVVCNFFGQNININDPC